MKINGYDITGKNVWAWIQGKGRMILNEKYPGIYESPQHILEQVVWREAIVNKACVDKGECIACKCEVPDKLYSDKACEGKCYPEIMSEHDWQRFKGFCLRNKMNMYDNKFDWETVLGDMSMLNPLIFQSIICSDKASVHLGWAETGSELKHSFELFNPNHQDLKINTLKPSCSCTTAIPDKWTVEPNTHCKLNVSIETKGFKLGYHEVWITIRYDEVKRMNLKITYDLK
jgi:hypothetical protein